MSKQILSRAQEHDKSRPEPGRRLGRALKAGYSFLIHAISLADMAKVETRLYGECATIVPGKMPALAVLNRELAWSWRCTRMGLSGLKGVIVSSKPT
jgi:hypothetical protein